LEKDWDVLILSVGRVRNKCQTVLHRNKRTFFLQSYL